MSDKPIEEGSTQEPEDAESRLIASARRQAFTRHGREEDGPGFTISEQDLGRLPERIGQYRIKRFVSAGGMGRVYEAEQEGTERTVAIKIIKASELSEKALRRFEYETRLLGRLQHPGIAQIHEVGVFTSPAGTHPFFSMEFVDGPRLTEYAWQHRLDSRQRLELVIRICEAVEHAHRKGVIHRDLKPANIIVDRQGQPKVLDFGVARAIDPDLQATTMLTRVGEPVGTLPYMSPEQIHGNPDDIDVRCDVYALGVICHELLTGCLPYNLHDKPRVEVLRIICEQEPEPVSTTDSSFRGDVETIVGKALEKEPAARYQSVRELAEDLRRHLDNEPIRARRIGRLGRLWRWCRREPVVAALTALALLLLVVLTLGSTIAVTVVNEARQDAVVLAEQRRRSLYAAQMNLALQAFERNEFDTALLLQQQRPKPGQEDLRGFEWDYLWQRMHAELATLGGHDGRVTAESILNGALVIAADSDLRVRGDGASFTANGPASIDGAGLFADDGGVMSLPLLTTYSQGNGADNVFRATGNGSVIDLSGLTTITGGEVQFSDLSIQALDGGQVNLSEVTRIVVPAGFHGGRRGVQVTADGTGSTVDLSSLTDFLDNSRNPGSTIDPSNGGRILVDTLTTAVGLTLIASAGETLSLPALTTYRRGNDGTPATVVLAADGTGALLDLPALETIVGSNIGGSHLLGTSHRSRARQSEQCDPGGGPIRQSGKQSPAAGRTTPVRRQRHGPTSLLFLRRQQQRDARLGQRHAAGHRYGRVGRLECRRFHGRDRSGNSSVLRPGAGRGQPVEQRCERYGAVRVRRGQLWRCGRCKSRRRRERRRHRPQHAPLGGDGDQPALRLRCHLSSCRPLRPFPRRNRRAR